MCFQMFSLIIITSVTHTYHSFLKRNCLALFFSSFPFALPLWSTSTVSSTTWLTSPHPHTHTIYHNQMRTFWLEWFVGLYLTVPGIFIYSFKEVISFFLGGGVGDPTICSDVSAYFFFFFGVWLFLPCHVCFSISIEPTSYIRLYFTVSSFFSGSRHWLFRNALLIFFAFR